MSYTRLEGLFNNFDFEKVVFVTLPFQYYKQMDGKVFNYCLQILQNCTVCELKRENMCYIMITSFSWKPYNCLHILHFQT